MEEEMLNFLMYKEIKFNYKQKLPSTTSVEEYNMK